MYTVRAHSRLIVKDFPGLWYGSHSEQSYA